MARDQRGFGVQEAGRQQATRDLCRLRRAPKHACRRDCAPSARPPNPIALLLDETGSWRNTASSPSHRQFGGRPAVNAAAVAQHDTGRNHRSHDRRRPTTAGSPTAAACRLAPWDIVAPPYPPTRNSTWSMPAGGSPVPSQTTTSTQVSRRPVASPDRRAGRLSSPSRRLVSRVQDGLAQTPHSNSRQTDRCVSPVRCECGRLACCSPVVLCRLRCRCGAQTPPTWVPKPDFSGEGGPNTTVPSPRRAVTNPSVPGQSPSPSSRRPPDRIRRSSRRNSPRRPGLRSS